MPNSSYWRTRFEQLEEAQINKGAAYYANLEKQFKDAQQGMQAKIEAWYGRLALNNEISLLDAKKMLNADELEEFHWSVEEYIKRGQENAVSQQWMKELENASAKVHISRLELQKLHIQQECEVLFGNMDDGLGGTVRNIFTDGYYHTAYEVQKGVGIGWSVNRLDENKLSNVLAQSWVPDGSNFSDRIWKSKVKLVTELNTSLTQSLIRGDAPDKAIKNIAKKLDVSKSAAGNLVMTESAYFASASQKQAFVDLDVERYEIVATLDSVTSAICQELDGKVFEIKDYTVGETAPPFHCRCRSCTAPYFDDEFTVDDKRAARDGDGKTYYVPTDLKYPEWHKKYVTDDPVEELKEKKKRNKDKDTEQHIRYKNSLGKQYAPQSVSEFQDIKYGDEAGYGVIKAQHSGTKYYEKAVDNEPLITSAIKKIVMDTNSSLLGLDHRIKEKASYIEKIGLNHVPGNNLYEISDIIRYTCEADTEKTLEIIDSLKDMGYNTVRVKNYWLDAKNPYNGINTIIQAPNGQKFEIQYHTEESFNLKNGKMHDLYKKQELMKDKRSREYIKIQDEMFTLSDELKIPEGIERVK